MIISCSAAWGQTKVIAWGNNQYYQCNIPAEATDLIAVEAGYEYFLGLKSDGTVIAWGYEEQGECNVPTGLTGVIAIAAGGYHALALKSDGTVVSWGLNNFGQATPPTGLTGVIAISAGEYHSMALKSNGTVVAWGRNQKGQCNIPAGLTNVKAISAGYEHSLALKNNGTVVAWGDNSQGQSSVPAGLTNVRIIDTKQWHNVAIKNDGTFVGWGYNYYNQCNLPAGIDSIIGIAAGSINTTVLKSNGTLLAFGSNNFDQNIPIQLSNVFAFDASWNNSIALFTCNITKPTITTSGATSICAENSTTLTVTNPRTDVSYIWSNGASGNSITVNTAGNYTVQAYNMRGCSSEVSEAIAISIIPPAPAPIISGAASFCEGGNTTLSVASPEPNTTYLWNNGMVGSSITVNMPGYYRVRGQNINGCLSLLSNTKSVVAQQPNYTSISKNICAGQVYTFGNQTLTQEGTYHATFPNAIGCDSVVTLNLTVQTIYPSFSRLSDVLVASPANATSYQWLLNEQPITGATNQLYLMLQSGNYSVVVTSGLCSDTSAVQQLHLTSVKSKTQAVINIFPNPSTGLINVLLDNVQSADYVLFNAMGKEVKADKLQGNKQPNILDMSNLSTGMYVLKVYTTGELITKQIHLMK